MSRVFRRWNMVEVVVAGDRVGGVIGEKIAGGLYEVIVQVKGRPCSGVFRTDEINFAGDERGRRRRIGGLAEGRSRGVDSRS
jgi:hypothetical protein